MLRENYKWILSTAIATLAVLVPIILYFLSLPKKSLEYEIISRSELIGEEFSTNNLELKIGGENAKRVILYTFRITNSGSEPILKEDFERSISINFPDDTKIFFARLKKKQPANLTLKYEFNNNRLLIKPLLLNSDDEFEIELFSSSNAYPDIDARIVGITKITSKLLDSKQYIKHFITSVLVFFLFIFYSKHSRLAFTKRNYSSNLSMRIGNGILSIVCCFSSIFLLDSVIDIENHITLVSSLIIIPISLGIIWARKEQKYNKKNAADR